jgi:phosphoglycerate dehydrogenase-like enzyme
VAELALTHMMALHRNLQLVLPRVKTGNFSLEGLVGSEATGKTIGIVGTGKIAQEFIKLVTPMAGRIIAYDIYENEDVKKMGVEYHDLGYVMKNSDVLSLHCPLTPDNRGFIDADALAAMRPGSILLNTARGELIDETALVEALQSGPLAGAGLDTFASEPPAADHPFWALDNLVVSPHVGANTREARIRVGISVVDQIAAYLTTGAIEPRNLVNTLAATAA